MLGFDKIILKSAELLKNNNIPDITSPENPLWFTCDESVSEDEKKNIGKGMITSVLPYKLQDSYNRDLKHREYPCAILENEYLKAVFLPTLGGRLWSLYDKKLGKDIVYKNDALIFGNLALRNAWFAGGVEWNVGVRGHSYFTCAPLFAKKVVGKLGHEILRMYEYEEIRRLVYIIEATLDSDKLIVNITVKNTESTPTYMYWWSNIAVEQKQGTKFFVPTNKSFVTSYRDGGFCISKVDIPNLDGKNVSDPYHAYDAVDYFFDIPNENKKWISSIELDNTGLLQYSNNRLFGRKAFLWGNLAGGKHWNKWLTHGRDYYEIQAGLAKTQFEHFLIDGYEEISWNEVYTGIRIEDNSKDYFEVCKEISSFVPEKFDFSEIFSADSEENIMIYGRGKGYLFEKIKGVLFHKKCDFPIESVTSNELYYLDILSGKDGSGDENTDFICGNEWYDIISNKGNLSAFDKYILSIICYRKADYNQAYDYLMQSVTEKEKYYSLIALALLLVNVFGKFNEALPYAERAIALANYDLYTMIKYGEIAIKCGAYDAFIKHYEKAPKHIRQNGRIKMYVGQCLVELGEIDYAKQFINDQLVVEDFKEGEYSVSNIWVKLYKQEMAIKQKRDIEVISDAEVLAEYPLPYSIDFRMH